MRQPARYSIIKTTLSVISKLSSVMAQVNLPNTVYFTIVGILKMLNKVVLQFKKVVSVATMKTQISII